MGGVRERYGDIVHGRHDLGVVICEWKISNWGDFSNTDFNVEVSNSDLR